MKKYSLCIVFGLSLHCLCTCASDHVWRDWPNSQSPGKPRLVETRLAPIRPIGAACIAFRRQLITSHNTNKRTKYRQTRTHTHCLYSFRSQLITSHKYRKTDRRLFTQFQSVESSQDVWQKYNSSNRVNVLGLWQCFSHCHWHPIWLPSFLHGCIWSSSVRRAFLHCASDQVLSEREKFKLNQSGAIYDASL